MHNFSLTNKEIKNLRIAHKKAKEKKYAYRIHAVILLGQEWNYSEVSDVLFTNRDTLRNYVVRYQKLGINGLLNDQYHGRSSQLTTNEIKLLDQHLQEVVYMRAKDIIEYVALEFDVRYSESGMTQLLHTLDYSYKKPKKVPGKANAEEQAKFIKKYREIKRKMNPEDSMLFMDAVHPHHQTIVGYGWIKKGTEKFIKTTSQQKKLNIQGAIDIDSHKVITHIAPWLTEESTLDFLEKIRKNIPEGQIYLGSDRASYYHTKRVKKYARALAITMVYLPPYSPNLNPIERLWLYFQKNVLYNRYYGT